MNPHLDNDGEVHLACARPGRWPAGAWRQLEALLAPREREAAQRLRFDVDRAAYVAAHAMLKALAARACDAAAEDMELCHDAKGRPFIAQAPDLHVSLSRSRDAVACVATKAAPVGVDIEPIDGKPADAGLLGEYVAASGPVTARQFFFHWTALEAFWKACGTGLADSNPRIDCMPRGASRFDVRLENALQRCAGYGAVVDACEGCALAVVLRAPAQPDFMVERIHCRSAADIEAMARAHAPQERFFAA